MNDSPMNQRHPRAASLLGLCLIALCTSWTAAAKSLPMFTAEQADRGKLAYAQNCAQCHGANLTDGHFAPPIKGLLFGWKWAGRPVSDLFTMVSTTMPPGGPGTLGATTYTQLIAYLLQANEVTKPGSVELPSQVEALTQMFMPGDSAVAAQGPGGGLSPGVVLPPWPTAPNPLDKLTPVTDALLKSPATGDWLTWRRTLDAEGFSPLTQINKANVKNLRIAWSRSLAPGPNEAAPLVHDGVMFVFSSGDHLDALDAATGTQLWQYSRILPPGSYPTLQRSISLYGDKVYFATSDAMVVALNAKTGKLVWQQLLGNTKIGTRVSGGPLVVNGKVMQGTVGLGNGGQKIFGLDAETGKILWDINTIAQPGDPNDKSWNDVPPEQRSGGSVWTAGSYDSDLKLAYFGVAQTYDTALLQHPVKKRGITNDGLYLDSTLAIDPETGRLVWHFQHLPNDQWDFDWAFERQILNLPVNGQTRKLVVTSGKPAVYDALDAATGKYAFSTDLGIQNFIKSIDPKTGAKKIEPSLVPGTGKTMTVCPHGGGAKSWMPASFNPTTKILYVPLNESCMDLIPVGPGELGTLTTGVRWVVRPALGSDGKVGRVQAINMETHQTLWTERQRAPQVSGVLATAGGVVFGGAMDRWFRAYDDATGKTLWKTQLPEEANNTPISYQVNGKQYVAVVVSTGSLISATFKPLTPELAAQRDAQGASVFVFELAQD